MTNFYLAFSKQRIGAIDRQWIRANAMKEYFERLLPKQAPSLNGEDGLNAYFVTDANTFMYTWYAYLFSVLEGTCDGIRKQVDNSLDEMHAVQMLCKNFDIEPDFYAAWKKLRNTTFHIRSDYYDQDMFRLFFQDQASATIRRVHRAVGDQLIRAMRQS